MVQPSAGLGVKPLLDGVHYGLVPIWGNLLICDTRPAAGFDAGGNPDALCPQFLCCCFPVTVHVNPFRWVSGAVRSYHTLYPISCQIKNVLGIFTPGGMQQAPRLSAGPAGCPT